MADAIAAYQRRIYSIGLTTTSGGNISIRDDDDVLWITPKGTDKGSMAPEQLAHSPFDAAAGRAVAWAPGNVPSSEWPFHEAIYAARSDVRAIIHAHPPCACALAIAAAPPQSGMLLGTRDACGDVQLAAYATPGTRALADAIVACFASGAHCVVMERHGVVVGAPSLAEAFHRFECLEYLARFTLCSRRCSAAYGVVATSWNVLALPPAPVPIPAPGSVPGGGNGAAERVAAFARRAYARGLLMAAAAGVFSERAGAGTAALLDDGADKSAATAGDAALVALDALRGRAAVHARVYARHAAVRAVITAHPPTALAYEMAISGAVDTLSRCTPEGHVVVGRVAGAAAGAEPDAVAAALDPAAGVAIALVEGDCVVVTGASPLQCFDRLEVLETVAQSVVDAAALGGGGSVRALTLSDAALRDVRDVCMGGK